jgi:hypothetical protein
MRWRVYYGDGGRFGDPDGAATDTPGLGVVAITQTDPENGRYVLAGDGYYWWEHDRWWSGDLLGCWDYLTRPGPRKVLFGRQVPNDRYQEILRIADTDPEFPARSAWQPGEPRPGEGG